MKKILSILLVFIFSISSAVSYNPTSSDETKLQVLYSKIDSIYQNNPTKIEKLHHQINLILPKLTKENKDKYYIIKLNNYLSLKINWVSLEDENYNLIKVIDWDTIKIMYKWVETSIRMIGIDTPELSTTRYWYVENYSDIAKDKLEEFIGNNSIQIELDESQWKYDKYNRLLAYVFVNWENVNLKMIENWLAKEYTYNSDYKYKNDFVTAENNAKNSQLLIWSEEDEIKEIDNKEEIKKDNEYYYYTSSHHSAKLYYCETDSDWEGLSKKYLKKYNSVEELLKDADNSAKTLNKECN